MYRFALRPAWLVSHILVLALIVLMINLGLWQLRRLDQRQATNDAVRSRIDEPDVDVAELLGGLGHDEVEELEFTAVTAEGTWLVDDQLYVRNRSLNGSPGRWVLTPLVLPDGSAVIVNRGWIPLLLDIEGPVTELDVTAAPTTVDGFVRPTQVRQGIQSSDPGEGELLELSRIDLVRIQQQVDYEVLPGYVQLETQPVDQPLPVALGRPDLGSGPHLSYAAQWFIFTTIALVGYPLVLRRVARDRQRGISVGDAQSRTGGGGGPDGGEHPDSGEALDAGDRGDDHGSGADRDPTVQPA